MNLDERRRAIEKAVNTVGINTILAGEPSERGIPIALDSARIRKIYAATTHGIMGPPLGEDDVNLIRALTQYVGDHAESQEGNAYFVSDLCDVPQTHSQKHNHLQNYQFNIQTFDLEEVLE